MNPIKASDLSVVIQGPVIPLGLDHSYSTESAVASVRKSLPGAEIIISTWKTSDTSDLKVDVVIESDDPGALVYPGGVSNVNRLIASSVAGLKTATRPYAVKMRTDMLIEKPRFLEFFEWNAIQNRKLAITGSRIISSTAFVRNPRRFTLLYHCSDIFHFGTTEDLLTFWDIPHIPKPFLAPEQHIFVSALRKAGRSANLVRADEISISLLADSEESLFSNFSIYTPKTLGITLPKHIETELLSGGVYDPQWFNLLRLAYGYKPLKLLCVISGFFQASLTKVTNVSKDWIKQKLPAYLSSHKN